MSALDEFSKVTYALDVPFGIGLSFDEFMDTIFTGYNSNIDYPLPPDFQTWANTPLNPPLYYLKLYYPISEGDEVAPIWKEYQTNAPITPKQIYETILAFYNQPLPSGTAAYYLQLDPDCLLRQATGDRYNGHPELYRHLGTHSDLKISDLLGDQLNLMGLEPYLDGYTLILEN